MDSGTARDGRPPVVPNDAARIPARILPLLFAHGLALVPSSRGPGCARGGSRPGSGRAGVDPRAGPRGVRLAGRARPQAGPDRSQAASRAGRGDAPRPETRRAERPVDLRLLELGRRPQRLPLGQRHLARAAAGPAVGAGLLEPGRRGISVGAGRLGAREPRNRADGARPRRLPRARPPICRRPRRASRPGRTAPPRGPASSGRPGSWYWQDTRYVWRPGFWAAVQPSWVWIPAHFVWTPGGYLFVEGYWDLPLASRGILFAPVYYAQPVYLQPAYVFSPSITIATSGLVANLFIQPSYHHYCFGDYYDRSFLSVGIFPWFSFTYSSGPARPGLSTTRCSRSTRQPTSGRIRGGSRGSARSTSCGETTWR